MIDRDNLPHRQSTLAIVINSKRKFLIVNKNAYKPDEWAFPGGGVDEDETSQQAVERELREELLSDKFEVLGKSQFTDQYEWPDETIQDVNYKKGKKFRGTKLTQFFVRFNGDEDEVRAGDGLRAVKWVDYTELKSHLIFDNQFESANQVIREFIKP